MVDKDNALADKTVDEAPTSLKESCYEIMHTLIFAFIVVILVMTFFFRMVDVDGESMMDTLHDRDKAYNKACNSNRG